MQLSRLLTRALRAAWATLSLSSLALALCGCLSGPSDVDTVDPLPFDPATVPVTPDPDAIDTATPSITGVVVDAVTGALLPDAIVWSNPSSGRVRTDAQGRYALTEAVTADTPYTLLAFAEGYRTSLTTHTAEGGKAIDVVVPLTPIQADAVLRLSPELLRIGVQTHRAALRLSNPSPSNGLVWCWAADDAAPDWLVPELRSGALAPGESVELALRIEGDAYLEALLAIYEDGSLPAGTTLATPELTLRYADLGPGTLAPANPAAACADPSLTQTAQFLVRAIPADAFTDAPSAQPNLTWARVSADGADLTDLARAGEALPDLPPGTPLDVEVTARVGNVLLRHADLALTLRSDTRTLAVQRLVSDLNGSARARVLVPDTDAPTTLDINIAAYHNPESTATLALTP